MAERDDQLMAVLSKFVRAFNNLNWNEFIECFTNDATVFMAYPPVATRTSVVGAFLPLFERASALPGPPYLNIAPEDLENVSLACVGAIRDATASKLTLYWR
jgi:hypothetical protein